MFRDTFCELLPVLNEETPLFHYSKSSLFHIDPTCPTTRFDMLKPAGSFNLFDLLSTTDHDRADKGVCPACLYKSTNIDNAPMLENVCLIMTMLDAPVSSDTAYFTQISKAFDAVIWSYPEEFSAVPAVADFLKDTLPRAWSTFWSILCSSESLICREELMGNEDLTHARTVYAFVEVASNSWFNGFGYSSKNTALLRISPFVVAHNRRLVLAHLPERTFNHLLLYTNMYTRQTCTYSPEELETALTLVEDGHTTLKDTLALAKALSL